MVHHLPLWLRLHFLPLDAPFLIVYSFFLVARPERCLLPTLWLRSSLLAWSPLLLLLLSYFQFMALWPTHLPRLRLTRKRGHTSSNWQQHLTILFGWVPSSFPLAQFSRTPLHAFKGHVHAITAVNWRSGDTPEDIPRHERATSRNSSSEACHRHMHKTPYIGYIAMHIVSTISAPIVIHYCSYDEGCWLAGWLAGWQIALVALQSARVRIEG